MNVRVVVRALPAALCAVVAAIAMAKPMRNTEDGIAWHQRHADMHAAGDGFVLTYGGGKRHIATSPAKARTASVMFDGLFAMAQDDLKHDSVTAIRDGAFDHGQPIPCHCFETGEKWPYVWTRDLSYSI